MIDKRPRIIDVERKPQKCPVCGERVVDIIYGTGDMTEIEFLMEYRREGMMGGDNIPRRPPIWECVCGCRRFRKMNRDGTDALVKVTQALVLLGKASTFSEGRYYVDTPYTFTGNEEIGKLIMQNAADYLTEKLGQHFYVYVIPD